MKPNINPSLWNRIEAFLIDDPSAGTKFSGKLAAQNGWTPAFTARAIAEYKKFIFLCCVSPAGTSPSKVIDEVWHLHLTYTHNYWKEFCGKVLQKELHHHPSKGGVAEEVRHRAWYGETLALYQDVFEEDPPADIWPPSATETTNEAKSNELPEVAYRAAYKKHLYVLLMPFLFPFLCGRLHPFALKGPQFLVFYTFLFAGTVVYLLLVRRHKQATVQEIISSASTTGANSFQIARYVFGKAKAIEASVVDLVSKGILIAERRERFSFYPTRMDETTKKENSLAENLLRHHSGNQALTMKDMAGLYNDDRSNHPELARVYQAVVKKDWGGHVAGALFLLVGLIRMEQGLHNGYPVAYLQVMMLFGFFVLLAMVVALSSKKLLQQAFTERYRQEGFAGSGQERQLQKFVFFGIAALAGTFAFANLEQTFRGNRTTLGSGDSSGCGSSCGSGCGGGCGGCGGGD